MTRKEFIEKTGFSNPRTNADLAVEACMQVAQDLWVNPGLRDAATAVIAALKELRGPAVVKGQGE